MLSAVLDVATAPRFGVYIGRDGAMYTLYVSRAHSSWSPLIKLDDFNHCVLCSFRLPSLVRSRDYLADVPFADACRLTQPKPTFKTCHPPHSHSALAMFMLFSVLVSHLAVELLLF